MHSAAVAAASNTARRFSAKLCDFGSAMTAPTNQPDFPGRSPCGSIRYACPEVAFLYTLETNREEAVRIWSPLVLEEQGGSPRFTGYNPFAADVWSFGVMLFLCVTGRFPFKSASLSCPKFRSFVRFTQPEVIDSHPLLKGGVGIWEEGGAPHSTSGLDSSKPPLKQWRWPSALSPALVDLLQWCLRVRAEERPSMQAVTGHPWFAQPSWTPVSPSYLSTQTTAQQEQKQRAFSTGTMQVSAGTSTPHNRQRRVGSDSTALHSRASRGGVNAAGMRRSAASGGGHFLPAPSKGGVTGQQGQSWTPPLSPHSRLDSKSGTVRSGGSGSLLSFGASDASSHRHRRGLGRSGRSHSGNSTGSAARNQKNLLGVAMNAGSSERAFHPPLSPKEPTGFGRPGSSGSSHGSLAGGSRGAQNEEAGSVYSGGTNMTTASRAGLFRRGRRTQQPQGGFGQYTPTSSHSLLTGAGGGDSGDAASLSLATSVGTEVNSVADGSIKHVQGGGVSSRTGGSVVTTASSGVAGGWVAHSPGSTKLGASASSDSAAGSAADALGDSAPPFTPLASQSSSDGPVRRQRAPQTVDIAAANGQGLQLPGWGGQHYGSFTGTVDPRSPSSQAPQKGSTFDEGGLVSAREEGAAPPVDESTSPPFSARASMGPDGSGPMLPPARDAVSSADSFSIPVVSTVEGGLSGHTPATASAIASVPGLLSAAGCEACEGGVACSAHASSRASRTGRLSMTYSEMTAEGGGSSVGGGGLSTRVDSAGISSPHLGALDDPGTARLSPRPIMGQGGGAGRMTPLRRIPVASTRSAREHVPRAAPNSPSEPDGGFVALRLSVSKPRSASVEQGGM